MIKKSKNIKKVSYCQPKLVIVIFVFYLKLKIGPNNKGILLTESISLKALSNIYQTIIYFIFISSINLPMNLLFLHNLFYSTLLKILWNHSPLF